MKENWLFHYLVKHSLLDIFCRFVKSGCCWWSHISLVLIRCLLTRLDGWLLPVYLGPKIFLHPGIRLLEKGGMGLGGQGRD